MKICCAYNVNEKDKIILKHFDDNINKYQDDKNIIEKLQNLLDDDIINANEIADGLFPTVRKNIFISHSKDDLKLAIQLANFLQSKLKATTFIDSLLWKNMYEYQNKLNQKYKYNNNYSYEIVNAIAKNMNIILATSLQREINECDILLFLNKEKNLSPSGNTFSCAIDSPWIYSELFFADIIMKNQKHTINESLVHSNTPKFQYDFSSKGFPKLDLNDFYIIANKCNNFKLKIVDAFLETINEKYANSKK